MTKFSLIAAAIVLSSTTSSYAFDGHNGILFNMTQKKVEAKGFVCKPPEEPQKGVIAECMHMDLTGVAFGLPTKDYYIQIGPSGKVDMIRATFSGNISSKDYNELRDNKIPFFFPTKEDKKSVFYETKYAGVGRDFWLAKNNAAAMLLYTSNFNNKTYRIFFMSPRVYAQNNNKEN